MSYIPFENIVFHYRTRSDWLLEDNTLDSPNSQESSQSDSIDSIDYWSTEAISTRRYFFAISVHLNFPDLHWDYFLQVWDSSPRKRKFDQIFQE